MSAAFEELDFQATAIGELCLRRRREPRLDNVTVYEVKLGDEFLMSSLFTVGEQALATRALELLDQRAANIVVGGLGLGYTACAALATARVADMLVVEALAPVIDWHRRGLVPGGAALANDARCELVLGDFFALAASAAGFDPRRPQRRFDAVLLDIDHSPRHRLDTGHDAFYSSSGLADLARHLVPRGIFAMWSNDAPDTDFCAVLENVFDAVSAEIVEFPNPYSGQRSSCTIYSARCRA